MHFDSQAGCGIYCVHSGLRIDNEKAKNRLRYSKYDQSVRFSQLLFAVNKIFRFLNIHHRNIGQKYLPMYVYIDFFFEM